MSLNNKIKQQGFTIVELLIVIVVIGILAAITIVAYNGVQNRAKSSSAQSAANTLIKKAEAANAAGTSGYPTTIAAFTANAESALVGSGLTLAAIAAQPPTPATVEYLSCPATGTGVGAKVGYWDYSASPAAKVVKNIGDTSGTCATTALAGGPY